MTYKIADDLASFETWIALGLEQLENYLAAWAEVDRLYG